MSKNYGGKVFGKKQYVLLPLAVAASGQDAWSGSA